MLCANRCGYSAAKFWPACQPHLQGGLHLAAPPPLALPRCLQLCHLLHQLGCMFEGGRGMKGWFSPCWCAHVLSTSSFQPHKAGPLCVLLAQQAFGAPAACSPRLRSRLASFFTKPATRSDTAANRASSSERNAACASPAVFSAVCSFSDQCRSRSWRSCRGGRLLELACSRRVRSLRWFSSLAAWEPPQDKERHIHASNQVLECMAPALPPAGCALRPQPASGPTVCPGLPAWQPRPPAPPPAGWPAAAAAQPKLPQHCS